MEARVEPVRGLPTDAERDDLGAARGAVSRGYRRQHREQGIRRPPIGKLDGILPIRQPCLAIRRVLRAYRANVGRRALLLLE